MPGPSKAHAISIDFYFGQSCFSSFGLAAQKCSEQQNGRMRCVYEWNATTIWNCIA